jgi:hypothetical protein
MWSGQNFQNNQNSRIVGILELLEFEEKTESRFLVWSKIRIFTANMSFGSMDKIIMLKK